MTSSSSSPVAKPAVMLTVAPTRSGSSASVRVSPASMARGTSFSAYVRFGFATVRLGAVLPSETLIVSLTAVLVAPSPSLSVNSTVRLSVEGKPETFS